MKLDKVRNRLLKKSRRFQEAKMLTLPTLVHELNIPINLFFPQIKKMLDNRCMFKLYVDVNIYYPDMSLRSIFLLPKKKPHACPKTDRGIV